MLPEPISRSKMQEQADSRLNVTLLNLCVLSGSATMSHVKKLSVLGVRSFGPDEPKIIEFSTPLTLILGQNGCGKTAS